jgi:hypothetical protein
VPYQRNVRQEDYELVVSERASPDLLGDEATHEVSPHARYVTGGNEQASLVSVLAAGVRETRAPFVGVSFDGANLVSPRVIEHALLASRVFDCPLVAVPGYQLGSAPQHVSETLGYGEKADADLLATIDWRRDGHELFTISCPDTVFQNGCLSPFNEAGCFFAPRDSWEALFDVQERLDTEGSVARYAFSRLALLPQAKLVVLASEGTFHQFHDCRSTREAPVRYADAIKIALRQLGKVPPPREPTLLGAFSGQSMMQLLDASRGAVLYHGLAAEAGRPPYPKDPS